MTKIFNIISLDSELYMVGDSSNIVEGNYYIHTGITHNTPKEKYYNMYLCNSPYREIDGVYYVDGSLAKDCYNIIASTNKSLNLPLLPSIEEDILELAAKVYTYAEGESDHIIQHNLKQDTRKIAWIRGYKAVFSKKWTDEDMLSWAEWLETKMFKVGDYWRFYSEYIPKNTHQSYTYKDAFQEYIKQTTLIPKQVEIEMEEIIYEMMEQSPIPSLHSWKPKLTNNTINIIRWMYEN